MMLAADDGFRRTEGSVLMQGQDSQLYIYMFPIYSSPWLSKSSTLLLLSSLCSYTLVYHNPLSWVEAHRNVYTLVRTCTSRPCVADVGQVLFSQCLSLSVSSNTFWCCPPSVFTSKYNTSVYLQLWRYCGVCSLKSVQIRERNTSSQQSSSGLCPSRICKQSIVTNF